MQILKYSKVKFVTAVDVSLLTSFWISLFSSLSSRSYCLTLEKKEKPPADFKSAKQVLLFFLDAVGRGVLFFFPFLWFQENGGQSGLQ